jgi:hypothetical protein
MEEEEEEEEEEDGEGEQGNRRRRRRRRRKGRGRVTKRGMRSCKPLPILLPNLTLRVPECTATQA